MVNRTTIGLDIGTTHVRAVELETKGARRAQEAPTVRAYGEVPLPPGAVRDGEVAEHETVVQAVKELWSRSKITGKDVVIGVGNQRVFTREMSLPWLPADQLRSSLPYHAQDALPMSVDEVLMDFVPVEELQGEGGRTVQGLFVAAQRDTVNAGVLAAQGAGLKVRAVDLNALALLRSLLRGQPAGQTVAVIDVGARVTNLSIATDGRPRLARTIASGGADVTDAVARSRGITGPEAEQLKQQLGVGFQAPTGYEDVTDAILSTARGLVEAIQGTLSYFQRSNPQHGLSGVLLSGGGAHLPGLGQYLASSVRLPVGLGDPLAGIRTTGTGIDKLTTPPSALALVLGLAQGDHA